MHFKKKIRFQFKVEIFKLHLIFEKFKTLKKPKMIQIIIAKIKKNLENLICNYEFRNS